MSLSSSPPPLCANIGVDDANADAQAASYSTLTVVTLRVYKCARMYTEIQEAAAEVMTAAPIHNCLRASMQAACRLCALFRHWQV